jgi:hypothetical protein
MIFKKKYKRSDWMEGLLWAERLPRKELSEHIVSGGARHKSEFYGEYVEGVKDYYLYRQNILDQIENREG